MRSTVCDYLMDSSLQMQVVDIEEVAWAPKYGLKGIIDASLQVKFESNANESNEKIMPLEFKTGKATSGQASFQSNIFLCKGVQRPSCVYLHFFQAPSMSFFFLFFFLSSIFLLYFSWYCCDIHSYFVNLCRQLWNIMPK